MCLRDGENKAKACCQPGWALCDIIKGAIQEVGGSIRALTLRER